MPFGVPYDRDVHCSECKGYGLVRYRVRAFGSLTEWVEGREETCKLCGGGGMRHLEDRPTDRPAEGCYP